MFKNLCSIFISYYEINTIDYGKSRFSIFKCASITYISTNILQLSVQTYVSNYSRFNPRSRLKK